jgi:hypothetical protein
MILGIFIGVAGTLVAEAVVIWWALNSNPNN